METIYMYFRIRTEQYDIFMTTVNVVSQILLYKKKKIGNAYEMEMHI